MIQYIIEMCNFKCIHYNNTSITLQIYMKNSLQMEALFL